MYALTGVLLWQARLTRSALVAIFPAMRNSLRLCVFILLAIGTLNAQSKPRGLENSIGLTKFFSALNEVKSGRRVEPVRIMHFGDSHIAADVFTRVLRERLQATFGDGGPGFIVPKNPMSTRRRGVVASATNGWTITGLGGRTSPDRFYGPAGFSLTANSAGERAWIETAGSHFEIYYMQQPGGATFDVTIDGERASDKPISANAAASVEVLGIDVPAGVHRFEVRTLNAGKMKLFGFVAEQIAPGVSYDVLGINGARANRILGWDQSHLAQAVRTRNPDLIILSYGANEVADGDWTPISYQLLLGTIVKRLRDAAPNSSILITGPPERADVPLFGRFNTLIAAQRAAAIDNHTGFWSAYDVMGGAGSMTAWTTKGLAQPDKVHLTTPGYTLLANRLFDDLMLAYGKVVR